MLRYSELFFLVKCIILNFVFKKYDFLLIFFTSVHIKNTLVRNTQKVNLNISDIELLKC